MQQLQIGTEQCMDSVLCFLLYWNIIIIIIIIIIFMHNYMQSSLCKYIGVFECVNIGRWVEK